MTIADIRTWACHYRRSIATVAAIFLFYTLMGFLFLPWFLQRYLTHTLADSFQHPIEVADVRFNPFLFKLRVDNFKILDGDGTALVSFEQFLFDYEVLSIFRLEYGLEKLLLEKPYLKLEADGQGSYTLLHMLAAKPDPQPQEVDKQPSSASLPVVLLRSLQINGGSVDYIDAARAGGFRQRADLPNLSIEDFYTQKSERANRLILELRDKDSGVINLETTVNLEPLHLVGKLSVQNMNLAPVWQWLMLPTNFHLQAPRFEMATNFDLQVNDSMDLQLDGGSLSLRDMALSNKSTPEMQVIKLPLLSVSDVQMNLQQQSVIIGAVQATDGLLDVVLDKQGAINLQALFESTPETAQPQDPTIQQNSVPVEPVKPWDVLVHQVAISNYTLHLKDEKPQDPFSITLSPVSIAINEFKPLSHDSFVIELESGLFSEKISQPASLVVNTRLQLTPLVADAHLDLQQLSLPLVQPYVQDIARVDIAGGIVGAVMDVHFESADKPKVNVTGVANIHKLSVMEKGKNRNLLSWNSLDVSGISYLMQENVLKVDKISLDHPDTGFVINADGSTNIQELLLPQPASKPSSDPMKMNLGKIEIKNANLGFADLSMKPNFKVAMHQLSGNIDGLSSDPKTQASVNLKGKVDRYAPVTIKGKVNPLAAKPSLDMHMAFSNLELTTFTPYSGVYAGFKIERGQLSLDIDYKMVDNKIQGKNRIVMDQLQLGNPVESNKAVNLPLRLAVALLKDENGVIDLGFEVGGDLDDPQFSVGGIIWKVLSNMIMKVVTSPFNALSGLMGGENTEGIDQIIFVPGQDELDEVSLTKLRTAAAMLNKRSSLRMNVQGNTLPEQDRLGIQSQKLVAVLREKDDDIPRGAFLSPQAAIENGDAYKAVERYYDKQGKEDLDDIEDRIEDDMKARGEKPDSKTLKALAYKKGWEKLQGNFSVSDEELNDLAMRRAKQIKAVMVEQNAVAPERIFVLDANNDPAKASLASALILDAY
jgi:hypothetical protein